MNRSKTVQNHSETVALNRWVFGVPCGVSGRSPRTARRAKMKKIPWRGVVEQSVEQALEAEFQILAQLSSNLGSQTLCPVTDWIVISSLQSDT